MARVRVVVSDENKERWNEYVEESTEYDNLSDLIRKSVEQQIKSDGRTSESGQYEELRDILDTVESIEKQQQQLSDSLYNHREKALNKDDMDELKNVIVDALWDYADMMRDIGDSDAE